MELNKLLSLLAYDPKNPLLFNSGFFLYMFLFFLLCYLVVYKHVRLRIVYVILFSLYFFYKSCGWYFLLILFSAVVDFNLSNWIYRATSHARKKILLVFSIVINLAMLAYFKYTDFFIDTINSFGHGHIDPLYIFLPIGISFYTFENISYTIDVYRGTFKPAVRFMDYCFFLSFFPKLVAGPIVRAADFIPQIRSRLNVTDAMLGRAFYLIMGGLMKKAVISDYISLNFVDRIFDNPGLYSGFENLMAVYAYTLQIYCDFSGYSDMAIGIALLIGFKVPDNFNFPYQSLSVTDFWRRWHISLSSWLRDYLYISLGGNRKGRLWQNVNLLITMLLGGLWHGASWKFVFWGGMHGLALIADKMFSVRMKPLWLKKTIAAFFTFHFVAFLWIYFRASSFEAAGQLLHRIATDFNPAVILPVIAGYKEVFFLIFIGYLLHFLPKKAHRNTERFVAKTPLVLKGILLAAVIWIVIQVKTAGIQPFIYFQF